MLIPCFALLAAALVAAEAPAESAPSAPPPAIVCTPDAVIIGGKSEPAEHPIALALSRSSPGQVIDIQAGDYQPFTIGFDKQSPWNARTKGGLPGQPVTLRGVGQVRILPGSGDTIAFSQAIPNRHIVFENLTIIPSERAALMFYKASGTQVYEGFKFYDCDILGNWNHVQDRGQNSKWGVWGHSLKDFAFVGRRRPAVIRDIRHEHAFYLQNARGDILIQNVQATQLGRTFCQFTARPGDGPPGVGTITVKDCVVEDVGIAQGDAHKGGYAFTLAGRHTGTVIFENNVYRAGFRPELRRLSKPGVPYGTGALVAWDGGGEPNGTLVLRNNRFEMAPGCGDRPTVSLGGCREVRFEGTNKIVSGASEVALEFDPLDGQKPRNTPIGRIVVDPKTEVQTGVIEERGRRRRLEELQR